MKIRHLIEPEDLSIEELDNILNLGSKIKKNPEEYSKTCQGKILASLFYEPSTRTRLSFEAAMYRLGGSVIGFSSPKSSSVAKGESLQDTIKTVGCYGDICVMRHHIEGAPKAALMKSNIPLINAGDGGHQHPTQTLTDLLTIKSLKGRLNNLTLGLCGDLKYGRTVHSLIKAMSRYENIKFILISPEELKIPKYIREEILIKKNIEFKETKNLEESLVDLDILYMTRIQQERFEDNSEYLRLKDTYILDTDKLKKAKEDMFILHPLPRVNEISTGVDDDRRAKYFQQVEYGMYIRMALILSLLNIENILKKDNIVDEEIIKSSKKCENSKCVVNYERNIKNIYKIVDKDKSLYKCFYCDNIQRLEGQEDIL